MPRYAANTTRMNDELGTRRSTYARGTLDEAQLAADPFVQSGAWLADALATPGIVEPNAMTVSTVSGQGRPSSRVVLLRGWDERGFVFYSNYASRKAAELADDAQAALLFWWGALERQLRIEGLVARVSDAESDAYFARRPRGHQLSAWASPQSTRMEKAALVAAMTDVDRRFPGPVPRPPHWGGFRVAPDRFEFWQGRPDRVHDRIVFEKDGGVWTPFRIAP